MIVHAGCAFRWWQKRIAHRHRQRHMLRFVNNFLAADTHPARQTVAAAAVFLTEVQA